jgi:hypothetical protein
MYGCDSDALPVPSQGVYAAEPDLRAYFEQFCRPVHVRLIYDGATGRGLHSSTIQLNLSRS